MAFTCLTSHAQNKFLSTDTWVTIEETSEYKIEMITQYCERLEDDLDKTELILRISNLTSKTLDLTWEFEYYYDNKCFNCDQKNIEFKSSIHLNPLETKQGQCGDRDKTLRHFVKFENIKTQMLTDFKIKNLQVNKADLK